MHEMGSGFEGEARRDEELKREMRHRFKNQLAVIGALAKLFARHTEGARELAIKLEQKLVTLAQAQDVLSESGGGPIAAPEAIARVLHASAAGEQVQFTGCPEVLLGDEAIQQLALLLGEVRTNASAHGALTRSGGRIELSGSLQDSVLTLLWREFCTRPVVPPAGDGGGFQLIRRLGSTGGKQANIAWHGLGIIVEFHVRTLRS